MNGRGDNVGQPLFFHAATVGRRVLDMALAPVGTTPYSPRTSGDGRGDRAFFVRGDQVI